MIDVFTFLRIFVVAESPGNHFFQKCLRDEIGGVFPIDLPEVNHRVGMWGVFGTQIRLQSYTEPLHCVPFSGLINAVETSHSQDHLSVLSQMLVRKQVLRSVVLPSRFSFARVENLYINSVRSRRTEVARH